jgi:xanthine dehydrogenase YagS FAD-binding subunit
MVHPSDLAPALIALDAGVRIVGPSGTRDVPVGNFFVLPRDDVERETVVEPGEVIVEILVPGTAPGLRSSYRKVRVRRSWDFALAGVALALSFDGDRVERSRVVFSGVAPIPWRSVEVEKVLTGDRLDSATITRAARVAVAGAQPLKHNGYKIHLLRGIVEEQLAELAKSS